MRVLALIALLWPASLSAQDGIRVQPVRPVASGPIGAALQLEFKIDTAGTPPARLEVLRNGEPVDLRPESDGLAIRLEARCNEAGVWLYSLRADAESGTREGRPMVVFCGSPRQEIFTGEYQAASVDDFRRGRSRTLHFLKTGTILHPLLGLPEGAEAVLPPRSEIRFAAYRSGGAIVLAGASGDLPSLPELREGVQHLRGIATPRPPVTGRTKAAVVIVRYSDTRDWPQWRETIHTDIIAKVGAAYHEWSFGQLPLELDYLGAYTLPARSPVPCLADTIIEAHLLIGGRRYLEELGLNLSNYRNVLFLAYNNGGVFECGQGDSASGIGLMGGDAAVFTTRMPLEKIVTTASHELGHSILILGHANRQSCPDQQAFEASRCTELEYGNLADVMGLGSGHVGGAAKSVLGWLKPVEVTKSGVYEVAALESKTSLPQVLKIDSTYVEYRRPIGLDKLIPASYRGVLINAASPVETRVFNLYEMLESWTVNPLLLSPFTGEGVPIHQRDKPAIQPGSCLQDPKNRYSACTVEAGESAAKIDVLIPTNTGVELALIDRPKDGALVQGQIRITGHALDQSGVKTVELLRGPEVLASTAKGVFDLTWTPPADKPGTVGLAIRATAVSGRSAVAPLSIVVPIPPSVRLLTPTAGTTLTVAAQVALEAEVEGTESAIRTVSFVIGRGTIIQAEAGGNGRYRAVWKPVEAGTYQILVEAYDTRGVRGTSAPVTVTCALAAKPAVGILAPMAGTAYEAGEPVPIVVQATASPANRIVSLIPDTFTLSEDGLYRGSITWEQPGRHRLKLSVMDDLGQTASAETDVSVVERGVARLRIQSPAPGSLYTIGVEVEIKASIVSRGDPIAEAHVYASGVLAGKAIRQEESEWWLIRWTPEAAGETELIALLTLADGSQVVTNVEAVRVLPPPQPPTSGAAD